MVLTYDDILDIRRTLLSVNVKSDSVAASVATELLRRTYDELCCMALFTAEHLAGSVDCDMGNYDEWVIDFKNSPHSGAYPEVPSSQP